MYSVTRQYRKPYGFRVVQVSVGSLDYTNIDTLLPKYKGDCEEFDLAIDAANAAIAFLSEASCLDPAMYEELVMLLVTDIKFRLVLQSLIVAKSEYDARNERHEWDLRLGETNSVQLWYSDHLD